MLFFAACFNDTFLYYVFIYLFIMLYYLLLLSLLCLLLLLFYTFTKWRWNNIIGKPCCHRSNTNISEVVIGNNSYSFECFRSLQTQALRGPTQIHELKNAWENNKGNEIFRFFVRFPEKKFTQKASFKQGKWKTLK